MSKNGKISAVVLGMSVSLIGGALASETVPPGDAINITAGDQFAVEAINRNYHDILQVYEGDSSGEYKFTGCGGVI